MFTGMDTMRATKRDTNTGPDTGWFTYPPLAAELLMPITRVSYRPAALLWMGASVLALVANVHVVARSLGLRPGLSAVLAVVCG